MIGVLSGLQQTVIYEAIGEWRKKSLQAPFVLEINVLAF